MILIPVKLNAQHTYLISKILRNFINKDNLTRIMATETAEELRLRKKNIEVRGRFVLEIDLGEKNLEMVTLNEIKKRHLQETGDLIIAVASFSSYFGGKASIPKEDIPFEAVAYRIGRCKDRTNHSTMHNETYVPVAFYKE